MENPGMPLMRLNKAAAGDFTCRGNFVIRCSTKTVLFCYDRMYCGLTDSKVLGRVPNGGVVFHDVKGQAPGPLFDILSHAYHSHRLLGEVYAMGKGIYDASRAFILRTFWSGSTLFPAKREIPLWKHHPRELRLTHVFSRRLALWRTVLRCAAPGPAGRRG